MEAWGVPGHSCPETFPRHAARRSVCTGRFPPQTGSFQREWLSAHAPPPPQGCQPLARGLAPAGREGGCVSSRHCLYNLPTRGGVEAWLGAGQVCLRTLPGVSPCLSALPREPVQSSQLCPVPWVLFPSQPATRLTRARGVTCPPRRPRAAGPTPPGVRVPWAESCRAQLCLLQEAPSSSVVLTKCPALLLSPMRRGVGHLPTVTLTAAPCPHRPLWLLIS